MKKQHQLLVWGCLVVTIMTNVFVSLNAQQGISVQPTRVAVVDVQKVFQDLQERNAIEAEITSKAEQVQKEDQQKQQEIRTLKSDLDILHPDSAEYKASRAKLEQKLIALRVWKEYMQRQIESEKTIQMEKLYKRVVDGIGVYAKSVGYDVVLYKDSEQDLRGKSTQQLAALIQVRKMLYANSNLDITAVVTQRLNNAYNHGKTQR